MADFPRVSGQEVVVLVGLPGSGKSTFCNRYLRGYLLLSKDNRPGADRQLRELAEAQRRNQNRAKPVPPVGVNAIRKRFQPPAPSEGFRGVVRAVPDGDDFDFEVRS